MLALKVNYKGIAKYLVGTPNEDRIVDLLCSSLILWYFAGFGYEGYLTTLFLIRQMIFGLRWWLKGILQGSVTEAMHS